MQKITTFLTFPGSAEEAAKLYVSLFEGSRIVTTMPGQGGKPLMVQLELFGQTYDFMNESSFPQLNVSTSLLVTCETQAEIDRYWDALKQGGKEVQCGWLVDRFGLHWQIVPRTFMEITTGPDRERAGRAMQAMMKMVKLDKAALENA